MNDLTAGVRLDTVAAHLHRRALIGDGDRIDVRELAGGVSGVVLAVEHDGRRMVVKQSLPRLRTQREWRCDPRRILVEGEALRVAHEITPHHVPVVLDLDEAALVLVMSAAPAGHRDWKSVLLGDPPPPSALTVSVATELGRILGRWHRTTTDRVRDGDARLQPFADRTVFDELRVTPFHRAVRERHPSVAGAIDRCIEDLLTAQTCLVHGDFSPKNVLVGDEVPWVVDFEVAHLGTPVFDLAFLTSHLALKAVHRPGSALTLAAAWHHFADVYADVTDRPLPDRLAVHVACLMLARVDGVSPATYLSLADQDRVRSMTTAILQRGEVDMTTLWRQVTG